MNDDLSRRSPGNHRRPRRTFEPRTFEPSSPATCDRYGRCGRRRGGLSLLTPLAIAIVVGVPLFNFFRTDLAALGVVKAWGLSVVESAAGLAIVALGLREAIPGRALRIRALVIAALVGLALPLVIYRVTTDTFTVGPRTWAQWRFGMVCFRTSVLAATPVLLRLRPVDAARVPASSRGDRHSVGSRMRADRRRRAAVVLRVHDAAAHAPGALCRGCRVDAPRRGHDQRDRSVAPEGVESRYERSAARPVGVGTRSRERLSEALQHHQVGSRGDESRVKDRLAIGRDRESQEHIARPFFNRSEDLVAPGGEIALVERHGSRARRAAQVIQVVRRRHCQRATHDAIEHALLIPAMSGDGI